MATLSQSKGPFTAPCISVLTFKWNMFPTVKQTSVEVTFTLSKLTAMDLLVHLTIHKRNWAVLCVANELFEFGEHFYFLCE